MTRIANDSYPTPVWMTEQLIKYADIKGRIAEIDKAIANCRDYKHGE
jgi:hypothetical protein